MRLLVRVAIGFVSVAALLSIGIALKHNVSAVDAVYTCTTNGTFHSPTNGPAQLDSDDQAKIVLASGWLEDMTHTRTDTVTDSSISPDSDYAPSYQGSVSGTFNLQDRSFASDASIQVTSPTTVSDSYRGVITGQVLETPTPWRWIIQAYKRENGVISQVAVQTLADGVTGAFSIDLSGVDPATPGEWMLGLLDAEASYAPYGTKWPDANYVGLEVQQYVVTDAVYYWSTTPAKTDGTFEFADSNTGKKLFRLVDTTTNPDDILAEYVKQTGLIRSYKYSSGEAGYGTALEDRSFVYDQAVAIFAAISTANDVQAKLLVDGLLELQTTSGAHDGGFVFAAPQLSPTYTDMLYRTGSHAIATDALLAYIEHYPSDVDVATYKAAATNALAYMQTTYSSSGQTEGLYKGGFGLYSGDPQVFDANYTIQWASTEHNIDAWHALMRAARVLGTDDVDYKGQATALNTAIYTRLFNVSEQRLNQGIDEDGPDTADPLDVNSWGAIQLYASGKVGAAKSALDRVGLFLNTKEGINGYAPFYDAGGYPGATPTVWFEGTFGVALAYYKTGHYDEYRNLLDNAATAQEANGSFRYATDADTMYEIGISESVASTAWYVIATAGRDTLWNECIYSPPVESDDEHASPVSTQGSKRSSINHAELSNTFTPDEVANTPLVDTPLSDDGSESDESTDTQDELTQLSGLDMKLVAVGGIIAVIAGGVVVWLIRRKG